MNDSSFEECVANNHAITITSDNAKVSSLLSTSKKRMDYLRTLAINQSSANFIFEGMYASTLELLHALVLIDGYAISNHLCLGFYLRDVLQKQSLFRKFDDVRIKRNKLTYYGKIMDFEVAQEAIEKSISLNNELIDLIDVKTD